VHRAEGTMDDSHHVARQNLTCLEFVPPGQSDWPGQWLDQGAGATRELQRRAFLKETLGVGDASVFHWVFRCRAIQYDEMKSGVQFNFFIAAISASHRTWGTVRSYQVAISNARSRVALVIVVGGGQSCASYPATGRLGSSR